MKKIPFWALVRRRVTGRVYKKTAIELYLHDHGASLGTRGGLGQHGGGKSCIVFLRSFLPPPRKQIRSQHHTCKPGEIAIV